MKSHWLYLKYVLRHKWYVFLACLGYGLVWRGIKHDWSKFLPSEWFPYKQFFYGNGMTREEASAIGYNFPCSEEVEMAFEKAWNHHQKFNDHHWQYWVRLGDDGTTLPLFMPDVSRKEMIADWMGAGKALGKPKTWEWYEKSKGNMQLHPETRIWVGLEMQRLKDNYRSDLKGQAMGFIGRSWFDE